MILTSFAWHIISVSRCFVVAIAEIACHDDIFCPSCTCFMQDGNGSKEFLEKSGMSLFGGKSESLIEPLLEWIGGRDTFQTAFRDQFVLFAQV